MTDSDIIKALEYCINNNHGCELCPLNCDPIYCRDVHEIATRIVCLQAENDRQQAEIKKLRCKVERLKKYDEERDIRLHAKLIRTAKDEAIKDFAERLKERAYTARTEWSHGKYLLVVEVDDIDEILAEMEGGK